MVNCQMFKSYFKDFALKTNLRASVGRRNFGVSTDEKCIETLQKHYLRIASDERHSKHLHSFMSLHYILLNSMIPRVCTVWYIHIFKFVRFVFMAPLSDRVLYLFTVIFRLCISILFDVYIKELTAKLWLLQFFFQLTLIAQLFTQEMLIRLFSLMICMLIHFPVAATIGCSTLGSHAFHMIKVMCTNLYKTKQ